MSIVECNKDQSKPENIWIILFRIAQDHKYQDSKEIFNSILTIFDSYNNYINELPMIQTFIKFLSLVDDLKTEKRSIGEISPYQIQQQFDELQKQGNFFYFNFLAHIMFKQILPKSIFISKYIQIYGTEFFFSFPLHNSEINSTNKIYLDKKLNFYLMKKYGKHANRREIERESQILHSNFSKFISSIQNETNDGILLPFFPLGNLKQLIDYPEVISLTFVDKIVIILEIAIAFNDLHSNDEFHGNLCSEFIQISSQKDAYLDSIYYDSRFEAESSIPLSPVFYRAPEKKEDADVDEGKLYDIFSFGVLMHEILTQKSSKSRMNKMSFEKRKEILKQYYCQFLFSGEKNEIFNDKRMLGMKEIIQKCMEIKSDDRFTTFNELIESIQSLPIYDQNEKEINFRISKAIDSHKYKCKLSDVVESYYRGNYDLKFIIEDILSVYQNNKVDITNDVIEEIYKAFDIKSKCNFNQITFSINNIGPNQMIDQNDDLLSLSIEANLIKAIPDKIEKKCEINFISPICSFENFIQNNHSKYDKYSLIWLYFISKELEIIHSKNLFYDEFETKSIGLYYNCETKMLIPSPILFYSFYKFNQVKNKESNYENQKIEKKQRKNIKQFFEIAKKIENIPQSLIKSIEKADNMHLVSYLLSNFIQKNANKEIIEIFHLNVSKNNYSLFEITFPALKDIFALFKANGYSNKDVLIDKISIEFKKITDK